MSREVGRGAFPAEDPETAPTARLPRELGPDRIARYEIRGELGRGGMGIVWRAWDPSLGRVVAVKEVRDAHAIERARERFQLEARAVARLRHPGIVRVLDFGVDGDRPYLVTEFVEGRSFEALLHEGLGQDAALDVVRQVAEALADAHENGIVHRDVKPGNVLVDASGHAKVLDFGLARDDARDGRLTRAGTVLGTPRYMSPEQAAGERVGPASDQFALGVILFEILAGRPYYGGDTFTTILADVLEKTPTPPSTFAPAVPGPLDQMCLRMLARDPEDRYPSLLQVAAILESGRRARGRPVLRRGFRIGRWAAIAGPIAGVAVGLATWWALPSAPVLPREAGEEPPAPDERRSTLRREVAAALDARYLEGELEDVAARLEAAEATARDFLRGDPDDPEAHRLLARILVEQGLYLEAAEAARRAVALAPREAECRFDLGRIHDLCSRVIRDVRDPLDPEEHRREARAALEACLALGHGDGDPLARATATVLILAARGDSPGLLEAGREAVRAFDGRRGVEEIGHVLAHSLPDAEALEAFGRAIAVCPGHVPSLVGRGLTKLRTEDHAGAIEDFELAARLQPRATRHPNYLGAVWMSAGDARRAILHFERAVAAVPANQTYVFNLAQAREMAGDPRALEDYERSIELDPSRREAYLGKARVLSGRRDDEAALAALETALRLSPGWAEALRVRARIQSARGRSDQARASIDEALRTAPEDLRLHLEAANYSLAQKDWNRALESLDTAIRLGRRSPDAFAARAQCHEALGRLESARSDLERALALGPEGPLRARIERDLERIRGRLGGG